jgi:hypothetical protein
MNKVPPNIEFLDIAIDKNISVSNIFYSQIMEHQLDLADNIKN